MRHVSKSKLEDTIKKYRRMRNKMEHRISEDDIVTGVISINSAMYVMEDFYNGNSIDINYEYHALECKECIIGGYCEVIDYGMLESSDMLIGFVECNEDDPDAFYQLTGAYGTKTWKIDATADYSAIVREMVVQVVQSRYIAVCKYTSPCYPNQGDLDNIVDYYSPLPEGGAYMAQVFCQTVGHSVLAYALPPELFDEYDNYPTDKLIKLEIESG